MYKQKKRGVSMKVFISWSGNLSHKIGLIFREWLPAMIPSLEPYVSSEDIDKGARWSTDIAKELEDSTFGILCVTKENLYAPWLSFEAGALSKTMDKSFVTPFLFDIKRSEVNGPILQFQSTIFEKNDIKKLILTLNKACGEVGIAETMLHKAFDIWYPTLEKELNELKSTIQQSEEVKENDKEAYSSEIIEEILELSRDNQKILRNPDTKINESIEDLKHKVDLTLSRLERNSDYEERRTINKYKSMFWDEIYHSVLPKCEKPYSFLIALGMFQEEFPWIYSMGKGLIDVLQSNADKETKVKSMINFRGLLEFTCDHPLMREIYGRNRNTRMIIKEMPYILNGLLKDLATEYNL